MRPCLLPVLAAAALLAACATPPAERLPGTGAAAAPGAPDPGPPAPGDTRALATRAVIEVAGARFPGVPAAPFARCVVAEATPAELRALAATAGQGAPEPAVATVRTVVQRQPALDCIIGAGLGPALVASQQGAS